MAAFLGEKIFELSPSVQKALTKVKDASLLPQGSRDRSRKPSMHWSGHLKGQRIQDGGDPSRRGIIS